MDEQAKLTQLITGFMPARAVQVAAHLGLPDLIRNGATDAEALSQATGIDPWRLGRLLRYLSAAGLFHKDGETFSLTGMGALLCRDTPGSQHAQAVNNYFGFTAWTEFEQVMRQKTSGYRLATGRGYFEAMQEIPAFGEAFDLTMNSMFVPETEALVARYDFGRFGHLLDVGGGNGEVLIHALTAHPGLTGTLFDLPHVVERADDRISAAGLGERCRRIGGSFFEPLPLTSDAILLRHILHDWQEADILVILERCRDALAPGGTLLVGEALIEDADTITMPLRLDMTMMAYYDGAERTLDEYRALVAKVGMTITEVVTITPVLSIMEARRA